MGNQLAGIAPSQILSVESYFSDIHDFEYDKSLGSTRFFKVARAKHREGLVVVKVFAIQDPTLPLTSYKQELEELKIRLHSAQNCLPFQKAAEKASEKAAMLFRQYVRDNLYDRISTRPFLNNIEKRWIAFQILTAVDQAHKSGVRHGDIKTENVMVTSWNWVLLTDFASFKPTYLPEDNPADFNYFFDTSRRRTCYIAPERFVDGGLFATELEYMRDPSTPLVDLNSNQRTRGELKRAMDIFSAGCVIAELFTEGVPLFDLSQLLAYRNGQFFPEQVLNKIEDCSIRELVTQMIHREPDKRLEAEDYLKQQRGNAFPEIFYTFLQPYMAQFAKETFLSADERILVIRKDLGNIIHNLCGHDLPEKAEGEPKENGLVILVSVITSCLQTLKYCDSKLAALELILHLAPRLSVEILLDRITPYLLHFSSDSVPRVRAEALRTLTKVLALVKEVPRNDVNIYPEYILPGIAHLAQDDATIVRLAYAENIALLAETALRFLELVQLKNLSMENDPNSEEIDEVTHPSGNYDTELQALHEMVQQKVVTLLSDPENIVKQTLMENGITRLCVFFGRQKANDVLLSHMITFLNDKNDWHLRGAFFDSIVGVAAYVGWQSSSILKPLLQQGLSDAEEFVIVKALNALTCMCQLGLLQKPHVYEFASDIAPFLCHPNLWIRYGAVGFITVVAHQISTADVYCKLMPYLDPYITQPIIQIERKLVLLSVLKEPVSRSIFDYALRSKDITSLFRHLHMRQKKRNGSLPDCPPPEDPAIAQLLKKLLSQVPEVTNVQNRKPTIQVLSSTILPSTYQIRITTCKTELQQLIQQKREQCNAERIAKQMMENAEWESKPPPPGWRPKGLLVAHLHEHKSAVNRIRVSDEHSLFATCSNDGTVKIWNSQKMEGKTTTTRSILTYSRIGGRVKTLTFCQGSQYLAIASDNGAVQLLGIEASKLPKSPKIHPLQSRVLDQKEDGCVVDMHHFNSGAQSVLAYATVNGALVGWDLRSSSNAWTLRHDLKSGLITSFAVDIHQCWLCIGTSSGTMACWDMRFQLPISSHCHPSRARIRRLSMHPLYQSWVIAAVQGNNEVSMWDMETGDRRFTLWASGAPPLSELQPSPHSVHGLYCSPADGNPILLTAGSDMKIRFWDLAYPERSYVIAGSTSSSSVSYYRKIIEGTEVVQEIQNKQKVGPSDDAPRKGPESLPVGHHDIITDVATFQTTQGFIVTASRDGIVKVWK
ncbi:phosphoinositide 3-kinase regulatory subunit 4 isoform X3 [Sagmatias obliquidens]|uniref:Phosphoinositide 3-kinase regulatory subunit 4 n=1 Tax=Tursiops truncatus TaxID=9739 RepID=A0A6J3R9P6_TURTR|nr:phosphoinositide 3-kinase regulatory subunit 4 isoform X3 [Lagenorhynchus obliquidens]XP_030732269.1 phosphoinositide 3-kinase regulatory subunit 4 isoform X3 [Globicephala melas]XP_033711184.1 phosphoinositide 3-kinase regulatory subunit 4 isoform X3 [Tursiops truncatus]